MNVIKIMGGLGNQFFQYAFGKAQMKNGISVSYDTSFYDPSKKQKYPRLLGLGKFNTTVPEATMLAQPTIKEDKYGFDLSLLKTRNRNFHGYWQFLPYFESMLPLLRKEFALKEEFYTPYFIRIKAAIESSNSVSIHVRRGDYLLQDWGVQPIRYYFDALYEFKNLPNKHYFIFSDDIQWCKDHFNPVYFEGQITFVSSEDYLDFELMKSCKHNIIASSTFSWWAAFLNSNPDKIVIAPAVWLGGEEENPTLIHYPSNWIKL